VSRSLSRAACVIALALAAAGCRGGQPSPSLDAAGKDLVKATRKAFRSFRFGLDRP
jgi:hypothetical protein